MEPTNPFGTLEQSFILPQCNVYGCFFKGVNPHDNYVFLSPNWTQAGFSDQTVILTINLTESNWQ